jgi:hypothetical protein
MPDCIWEGFHANMNCTQPVLSRDDDLPTLPIKHVREAPAKHPLDGERGPRDGMPAIKRRRNVSLPALAPSVSWGCKPFDRGCGTTGRR